MSKLMTEFVDRLKVIERGEQPVRGQNCAPYTFNARIKKPLHKFRKHQRIVLKITNRADVQSRCEKAIKTLFFFILLKYHFTGNKLFTKSSGKRNIYFDIL